MVGKRRSLRLGQVYNLPIPFRMYASGAGAALLLSFAIIALVTRGPAGIVPSLAAAHQCVIEAPSGVVDTLVWAGLLGLLFTIATGIFGAANPLANFNMTFFWIIFLLGLTYLTAVVGDIYALANPRSLCDWLERWRPGFWRGSSLIRDGSALPGSDALRRADLDGAVGQGAPRHFPSCCSAIRP